MSPRSGTREFQEIRRPAERIGIAIGGLCSFLYWPYGYEVTSVNVRAACSHTLKRAANAGVRAAVQTRIGALFDNPAARSGFVASVIGKEMGLD